MKELLLKGVDGVWKYNNSKMDFCPAYLEAVEIPDDAEVSCVNYEGTLNFYKNINGKWALKNSFCSSEWYVPNSYVLPAGYNPYDGKLEVVWERETNKLLTKTPFTYDRLLGCYVEHYASCSNSGYIVSVRHNTIGEPVFEVEGSEWDYGILAKEVIFYTEDNQPLSFEQYKETYYTEDTSNEVVK